MRLFVAIALKESLRGAIVQFQQDLKPAAPELRWVRPEGMHLTLKFIGHVEDDTLPQITKALAQVKADAPAEIDCREAGFLPNERRPRVLFVAISADPVLAELAQKIEDALAPLGIEREARAFRAHLTLARFPKGKPRSIQRLKEKISQLPSRNFGQFHPEEFFLIQSQLSPGGAKYTTLERFFFVEAPGN